MASKPTQRTLQHLRKLGHTADVTEKWIPQANVRKDLFGFIDLLYLPATYDGPIVAVQATDGTSHSKRREKILGIEAARQWLASGGRIEVWSWRAKKIKLGGVAIRYEPRIENLTLDDFAASSREDAAGE